jgi:hypothetical protein
MDEMAEWDREGIKIKLENAQIKGNISSQKAYLYKLILKAMRAFHAESNGIFAAKELLLDADFLFQKGQYQASLSLLKKAQSDPSMQSSPLVQLEVLEKESELLMMLEKDGLPEIQEKIQRTRAMWLERLHFEEKITEAYWAAFALHRKYGNLVQEPQKTLVQPHWAVLATVPAEQALTPLARIRYRYLCWLRAQSSGNKTETLKASQQLLAAWDAEPILRAEFPSRYRMALANHLATLFSVEQFEDFPEILKKLKATPATNMDDEGEVFQNVALYELLFYMNAGQLAQAESVIPSIRQGLERFSHKINKSRELTFRFNIAVLYFFREKWSESLKWINSIMNDKPSGHRKDVQDAARIFELALHFELGHWDLLEHKIRSTLRYFKSDHKMADYGKKVAHFLKQILSSPDPLLAIRSTSDLLEQLELEAHSSPLPSWLEITLWLRSHQQRLPLAEVLQAFREKK